MRAMCKILKIWTAKQELVGQRLAGYRLWWIASCGHGSNYEEAVIELKADKGKGGQLWFKVHQLAPKLLQSEATMEISTAAAYRGGKQGPKKLSRPRPNARVSPEISTNHHPWKLRRSRITSFHTARLLLVLLLSR